MSPKDTAAMPLAEMARKSRVGQLWSDLNFSNENGSNLVGEVSTPMILRNFCPTHRQKKFVLKGLMWR